MPQEKSTASGVGIANRVLQDLVPCLDQADLLDRLHDLLEELFPHDAALMITVEEHDPPRMVVARANGLGDMSSLPIPLEAGHLIDPWVWNDGPLHIPDLQESPARVSDLFAQQGIRSLLSIPVPVPGDGGTAAVLLLAHREPGGFAGVSDDHVDELRRSVAVPLANAIQVSRQQQVARELLDQAAAIWDEMDPGSDPAQILPRLLDQALEASGAEAGTIMVVVPESGSLYVRAAHGLKTRPAAAEQLPWGTASAAPVHALTGPRFERNIGEGGSANRIRAAAAEGFQTYLAVPVRGAHSLEASGLLNLYWRSDVGPLEESKLGLLRSIARAIATVLQNSEITNRQENSDRAIGQFHQHRARLLSLIGHQLRTPITSISGYAQLLLRRSPDPASSTARYAGTILSEARRMDVLIGNMLEISRLEDALLAVQSRPFDLRGLLDNMRGDGSLLSALNGPQLVWMLPESLPVVVGDPLRLRQALLALFRHVRANLPENAPPLRLEVRQAELGAQPVVEIGIGPDPPFGESKSKNEALGLINLRKVVDGAQAQEDELALYTALELLGAMKAALFKTDHSTERESFIISIPILKAHNE